MPRAPKPSGKVKTPKSKGGRPRKSAEMHEGESALKRFKAGMQFALKGGPAA